MKRILVTFYALAGIAALALGGIAYALALPAGPAAVAWFLSSATVGSAAVALAGRILYVLQRPRTVRVRADFD